ncbi:MAG: AAA family ATPase [Candidatus Sulfotelmatobacter sp.]|jgi:general secretion pathway protein A
MFLKFYGLREQPFGVTPDPRFLYLSPGHREALASLYYGIESGRGFMALIAKPGTGKTTLLFHLLEKFRADARVAFLFQTQCDSREFMRFLLADLGCETYEHDFVRMHDEFNKLLLQECRAGKRFIIVVDEAQNLDSSVLETIRLLSDFETPRAKLLQIILAGQPELADKLARRNLSQLRQRISLLSGLAPLSVEESSHYVDHRLRIAGYSGSALFDPAAMHAITHFTEGIPRNINNFCFNALSLGCALGEKVIGLSVVQEVISDLDITKHVTQVPSVAVPHYEDLAPAVNGEFPPSSAIRSAPAGKPTLAPTEARSYMQQVALQLRDWKHSGNGPKL